MVIVEAVNICSSRKHSIILWEKILKKYFVKIPLYIFQCNHIKTILIQFISFILD